jgi:hypothetical protein
MRLALNCSFVRPTTRRHLDPVEICVNWLVNHKTMTMAEFWQEIEASLQSYQWVYRFCLAVSLVFYMELSAYLSNNDQRAVSRMWIGVVLDVMLILAVEFALADVGGLVCRAAFYSSV